MQHSSQNAQPARVQEQRVIMLPELVLVQYLQLCAAYFDLLIVNLVMCEVSQECSLEQIQALTSQ